MYSAYIRYAAAARGHRANKRWAALEPEDFACLEPRLEAVMDRDVVYGLS